MVKEFTYLGFRIERTLNWDFQYSNTLRNVNEKYIMLAKLRWMLGKDICLLLYKSFIMPLIEYGVIFYTLATTKCQGKIQKVQKRCLRLIH